VLVDKPVPRKFQFGEIEIFEGEIPGTLNWKTMFKRTIENFVCEKCGYEVEGNGFTNHCPECLWSKHVDIDPGDREATCGGLMAPTEVQKKGSEYNIIHVCEKCGFTRVNKAQKEDSFDMLAQIQSEKQFS